MTQQKSSLFLERLAVGYYRVLIILFIIYYAGRFAP